MAFWSTHRGVVFAVALAYIGHVHALTSAKGCTCTSDCGPSFDDSRPWCYTANSCGSYAYSRASYYDYCTPPSPPPPPQSSSDGNQYHRCYQASDCSSQCSSWAQCTFNPNGPSCAASPFSYSCDFRTTSCAGDMTGYYGYCPPNTGFSLSSTCTTPTSPYGCVAALTIQASPPSSPPPPPRSPPPPFISTPPTAQSICPSPVAGVRCLTSYVPNPSCTIQSAPCWSAFAPTSSAGLPVIAAPSDRFGICVKATFTCTADNSDAIGGTGYCSARNIGAVVTVYDGFTGATQSQSVGMCEMFFAYVRPNATATGISFCSTNNCNAPPTQTSTPSPATSPSPPPVITPSFCPAASTATACYNGVTGPAGAVAFYQSTWSGDLPSPPASAPVPANTLCISYSTPCTQYGVSIILSDGTVYNETMTIAQCPLGQSVTFYGLTDFDICASSLPTMLQYPNIYVSPVVCGTTLCNSPPRTSAPSSPPPPPSAAPPSNFSTPATSQPPSSRSSSSTGNNVVLIAATVGGGVGLIMLVLLFVGAYCCFCSSKKIHHVTDGK